MIHKSMALTAMLGAIASLVVAPVFGSPPRQTITPLPAVPFGVGEVMSYKASLKVGFIGGGGEASLRVEGIDTVHGNPAYRLALHIRGGSGVQGQRRRPLLARC